jgi:hypothetical protein
MIRSPRSSIGVAAASLVLAFLIVGCGSGGGSTAPSPSAPSGVSDLPSSPPSEVPAGSAGAIDTDVATACLTLVAEDCARALAAASAELDPAVDPAPVYVQVGPFGCATGDRCPETLVSRPEGDVTIEFPGGAAINVHLVSAPDGSLQATRDQGFGIAVEPTSPVGFPAGPQPFTLGHCGIFSGVDADGSWWDPVGPVPMDSGDAVNATAGVLNLTDRTHGTFTAPTGFALQLLRRDGAKVLPPCM